MYRHQVLNASRAWYQVHVYKISVGVKSVSTEKITNLEKSTLIEISWLRRNNRVKVTINIHMTHAIYMYLRCYKSNFNKYNR